MHIKKQDSVFQVEDASYSYSKGKEIFSNINLELNRGDIFTILGPNGVGKSTFLNCLANLFSLKSGRILISGEDIKNIKINELAKTMGYVPQIHESTFNYSIRDYIVMGRAPHMGMFETPGEKEYKKVDEIMERLNISYMSEKLYSEVSGGERQQVQIGKVLVQESKIILLDEPTNHLDYGNQIKILKIIAQLADEGIIILMTTHMPDHAILLGGKIGILSPEGSMKFGLVSEIMTEELLSETYGTKLHLVQVEEVGRLACVPSNIR